MSEGDSVYLQALKSIAEMAQVATRTDGVETAEEAPPSYDGTTSATCVLKSLPPRLLARAAETAVQVNPLNAPHLAGAVTAPRAKGEPASPQHLAVVTAKYWGASARVLTVSFMESTPPDLKNRIISHMNAWAQASCISFALTNDTGNVRISRGPGGYYSYLGTDVLLIPQNQQTMNLEGFTMATSESEYRRVVRHEAGHTLGFPHEHMRAGLVSRIDRDKAYMWFWQMYHWPPAVVDQQVLTSLDEASLFGTPVDETSIMCYQLPGDITKDGRPIVGGLDINTNDYLFAGSIYPKIALHTTRETEDWDEKDDVVTPDIKAGLVAQGERSRVRA